MELLSPVGNFDNLIAAVQNGADAVYLGADVFNARAGAKNFNRNELKEAILYARKRGVDVHLTLNTLLFNHELQEALEVAKFAYQCGISAIIVQDIGLALELIRRFPDLPIHSSTQMTISNLDGVNLMQKLGFKRVVLARELSMQEIDKIRQNTTMELECFGHGALCVSYSGQCLFSSIVGGRSGNRGLCAGPCRLNYGLLKDGKNIENGYLLSPKDICTLEILPQLLDLGIDSLKIEGRKKSYEYVSIVTKMYRKYIDLAKDKSKEYKVEKEDLQQILQIYNRGGMGTGYLENRQNIVYLEKPNHLGVYVGEVKTIDRKRKRITIAKAEEIFTGDVINIHENTSYISEIVNGNTVGEIKNIENVRVGDEVYRIVSNQLNKKQWEIYKKEVRKVEISSKLYLEGENLCLELYNNEIDVKSALKYEKSDVNEIDKSRILCQIQKTGNTIFDIKNVEIEVENLKLPISQLNQLRREAIEKFEKALENSIVRRYDKAMDLEIPKVKKIAKVKPKVNLYLQKFDNQIDYAKIPYHEIYVPFKDLAKAGSLRDCIAILPNIIDKNYEKLIEENRAFFEKVKAVQISHLSQIELLKRMKIDKKIVADDTLNITNHLSEKFLQELRIQRFTISPELDKNAINEFGSNLEKELVVYGRPCLMTSKYCPIGKNGDCKMACQKGNYALKDRKEFVFPIVSDSVNCHTRIYYSKALTRSAREMPVDFLRVDVLQETEEEIQEIFSRINSEKTNRFK